VAATIDCKMTMIVRIKFSCLHEQTDEDNMEEVMSFCEKKL